MKLIDLLSLVRDDTNVTVFVGVEKVAEYNGRDSIDEKFFKKKVIEVTVPSALEKELWIEIEEE